MTTLAFVSALFMSIACLFAATVWLFLWRRARGNRYMLLAGAAWLALCLYFSLLAISAGESPVVTRADIAVGVRWSSFVVGGLVIAGKMLLLRAMWRNSREAGNVKGANS